MKVQHDLKVRLKYHKACIKYLRIQISYKVSRLRQIPFNEIHKELETLRNHTKMEIIFKRQLSNLA